VPGYQSGVLTGARLTADPGLGEGLGDVRCFACDAEIELGAGERIGFRDDCNRCGQDLHACRNCAHHDPSAYNECHESSAERVADRERANRCEYFTPGEGGGGEVADTRSNARADLENLFKK
jgi:hypothetical protein